MGAPEKTVWDMELHTRAKHEILKNYLQAWFPIMTQGNPRVIVLDGFAGPGEYRDGSSGSPVIAIETLLSNRAAMSYPGQKVFYFIEADSKRSAHLDALLRSRFAGRVPSNVIWTVIPGKFDEHMTALLDELDQHASALAPTFAFLDPFGYSHTPMEIIARLMKHSKCEVFINFMFEEANRFISWDNPAHDKHYDSLFSTPEWREIRQQALTPDIRERRVHDLYARQLTVAGGATYVRSFRMRNKSNRTDYYLFFGTRNLTGLDKMKQAMWKADPSGAYDFSDNTNPDQPVLFGLEPDYAELRGMLGHAFSGQVATVQEVEEYVVAKTPYCSNHYKRVLKSMEKDGSIVALNPSATRPKGTYADQRMQLRFL